MSKKIIAVGATGFALAVGILNTFLNNQEWFRTIDLGEINLVQPDLKPGPWFCYYLGDYLTAHPGEEVVRSHPVQIRTGSFIWATATPEWDRGWFEKRGFEFPAKWMPYGELRGLSMDMNPMGL